MIDLSKKDNLTGFTLDEIIDYDYPEHDSPNGTFFVSRVYPYEVTTRAQWEETRRIELSKPLKATTNPKNLSCLGRAVHYVKKLFY